MEQNINTQTNEIILEYKKWIITPKKKRHEQKKKKALQRLGKIAKTLRWQVAHFVDDKGRVRKRIKPKNAKKEKIRRRKFALRMKRLRGE